MAARRLIPLLDRVLVERVQAATKSAGGVLLPETALPKVRINTNVAVWGSGGRDDLWRKATVRCWRVLD